MKSRMWGFGTQPAANGFERGWYKRHLAGREFPSRAHAMRHLAIVFDQQLHGGSRDEADWIISRFPNASRPALRKIRAQGLQAQIEELTGA